MAAVNVIMWRRNVHSNIVVHPNGATLTRKVDVKKNSGEVFSKTQREGNPTNTTAVFLGYLPSFFLKLTGFFSNELRWRWAGGGLKVG